MDKAPDFVLDTVCHQIKNKVTKRMRELLAQGILSENEFYYIDYMLQKFLLIPHCNMPIQTVIKKAKLSSTFSE
jgi:hypothetical protein